MAKGSKDCLHETWAAIGSDITGDLAHRLNQLDTGILLNIIIIMGHLNPAHNAPCLTSCTVCLHKAFHACHHATGMITLKTTHERILYDITSHAVSLPRISTEPPAPPYTQAALFFAR